MGSGCCPNCIPPYTVYWTLMCKDCSAEWYMHNRWWGWGFECRDCSPCCKPHRLQNIQQDSCAPSGILQKHLYNCLQPLCCLLSCSHYCLIFYVETAHFSFVHLLSFKCIGVHCYLQAGDPASVLHGSPQAHCLLTRNLLFDLELLAHADYFVGTTKSGLSPLVEVRSLSVSHSYRVSCGSWYSTSIFYASCRIDNSQCVLINYIEGFWEVRSSHSITSWSP